MTIIPGMVMDVVVAASLKIFVETTESNLERPVMMAIQETVMGVTLPVNLKISDLEK